MPAPETSFATANDASGTRQQARPVWTAESLHYGWTLSMLELIVSI